MYLWDKVKSNRNTPPAMWEEDNGFIYYKGKLYVPNDRSLRKDIVKSCHDSIVADDFGYVCLDKGKESQ